MLAVYNEDLGKVKILLNAGADKNIKNNDGKTAKDIDVVDYVNKNNVSKEIKSLLDLKIMIGHHPQRP